MKTYFTSSAYWSVVFFILILSTHHSKACICSVCVCGRGGGGRDEHIYPYAFVSASGSYEMGHHK